MIMISVMPNAEQNTEPERYLSYVLRANFMT